MLGDPPPHDLEVTTVPAKVRAGSAHHAPGTGPVVPGPTLPSSPPASTVVSTWKRRLFHSSE